MRAAAVERATLGDFTPRSGVPQLVGNPVAARKCGHSYERYNAGEGRTLGEAGHSPGAGFVDIFERSEFWCSGWGRRGVGE